MILEHPRRVRHNPADPYNKAVARRMGIMQNPHIKKTDTKWHVHRQPLNDKSKNTEFWR